MFIKKVFSVKETKTKREVARERKASFKAKPENYNLITSKKSF